METIELNGKKYYSEKPQAYSPTEYKVVRSYAAGMTFIRECEYDDISECVLISLFFDCAAPGHEYCNFALGKSEAEELIKRLQNAVVTIP